MNIQYHPADFEDPRPGYGSIPPRSWNVYSDSDKLSLNGDWRFRYSTTAYVSNDFAMHSDFDDSPWDTLPVPSHWVLHGYGAPAYQNVKFPFPVDAPFCDTENPTGCYRRRFDLPEGWALGNGKVSPLIMMQ